MPLTSTISPLRSAELSPGFDERSHLEGSPPIHSAVAGESQADARRWCTLAVGSLVGAGLLSLAVVVGRLPILSRIIDDPLFFKRCLVVHVDLALVVWFYAFLAGLLSLAAPARRSRVSVVAHALAVSGVLAMLAGALVRGAQPVLANYVPVIDHPLFGGGLAAFFVGALLFFVHALGAPAFSTSECRAATDAAPRDAARHSDVENGAAANGTATSQTTTPPSSALPADAVLGLRAAAVTVVLAAATWVSARAGLPTGLDTYTRAEFLAWGPGHVLQAANACAMLAVWLWLLERATGQTVLSPRAAQLVFGALVLPQTAMPLLTARGTLDPLYHTGATQLMRWAIFPAVLVVLGAGIVHLRRHRTAGRVFGPPSGQRANGAIYFQPGATPQEIGWQERQGRSPAATSVALTGFIASAALALLGLILGACIRDSNTLVPAHYHASLGAVTVAFMTAAYFICDRLRRDLLQQSKDDTALCAPPALFRAARWQLAVFGVGQTIFALGFALGGAYGLGRKAYAAEQHVRSAGEVCGLVVMGVGGLVAVAGGVWFLFLVLREMRAWWRRAPRPNSRDAAMLDAPALLSKSEGRATISAMPHVARDSDLEGA